MLLSDLKPPDDFEKQISLSDGNDAFKQAEVNSVQDSDEFAVLSSERDIATHIVSIHDDPSLNPWTVRAFVIGLGLSAFGGVLGKFSILRLIVWR
jgi:hypothetical protein